MRIKIAALGIMLAATATQAQAPAFELIGRIRALPNYSVFDQAYRQRLYESESPFVASAAGSYALRAEAEERLSLALEAFRWKDPEFFKLVMDSYALQLTEREAAK